MASQKHVRAAKRNMVDAMERAGFASVGGLRHIARIWRHLELEDSLHWVEVRGRNKETVEMLYETGLTKPNLTSEDLGVIVETWSFPLYSMDLSPIQVDVETLREEQRAWAHDW